MAEFDEKLNALLANPQAMEQIMQMARSLSASPAEASAPPAAVSAAAAQPPAPSQGADPPAAPAAVGEILSGLGEVDIRSLTALMPLFRELGGAQNSQARQLLFAMRPYLKPERQDKVERALQLARLFRVGRQFLLRRNGDV